jgi:hypothetical protein
VRDAFTKVGWNPRSHRAQVIEACTIFCQREVASASQLTVPEATELAAALRLMAVSDEPLVTLEEHLAAWRHDWEQNNPGTYDRVMG